jgi:hypothetical protein
LGRAREFCFSVAISCFRKSASSPSTEVAMALAGTEQVRWAWREARAGRSGAGRGARERAREAAGRGRALLRASLRPPRIRLLAELDIPIRSGISNKLIAS